MHPRNTARIYCTVFLLWLCLQIHVTFFVSKDPFPVSSFKLIYRKSFAGHAQNGINSSRLWVISAQGNLICYAWMVPENARLVPPTPGTMTRPLHEIGLSTRSIQGGGSTNIHFHDIAEEKFRQCGQ